MCLSSLFSWIHMMTIQSAKIFVTIIIISNDLHHILQMIQILSKSFKLVISDSLNVEILPLGLFRKLEEHRLISSQNVAK